MKAVLKSCTEFPQDAILVGSNYYHDRLKRKCSFEVHNATKKTPRYCIL
jgi:hypothetical protein